VTAEPWPGVPVRGRNAASRADACWLPIAPGLTPHGLRHTYKTLMVELGTPATVMDEQMGHSDGSVQARYAHTTADMVRRLLDGLTAAWENALAARRSAPPARRLRSWTGYSAPKSSPSILPSRLRRRKGPVREFARPVLTCNFSVGLTGFEPATP
jgi:hypothetical protein